MGPDSSLTPEQQQTQSMSQQQQLQYYSLANQLQQQQLQNSISQIGIPTSGMQSMGFSGGGYNPQQVDPWSYSSYG